MSIDYNVMFCRRFAFFSIVVHFYSAKLSSTPRNVLVPKFTQISPIKTSRLDVHFNPIGQGVGAGMVICLEQVADLHMSQLMPLPLTVSCFSKIQIGFTFLVPADTGSPGKRAVKWMCVCACACACVCVCVCVCGFGSRRVQKMSGHKKERKNKHHVRVLFHPRAPCWILACGVISLT